MSSLPFSPPSYTEEEVEAVANCVKTAWTEQALEQKN